MPRLYQEDLFDLPQVHLPDWNLIARLEDLLRPYLPTCQSTTGEPKPMYYALDSRGAYDARTADDLRQVVDAQEESPDTVRVTLVSPAMPDQRFVNVFMSSTLGTGGRVQSEGEAFVNSLRRRERRFESCPGAR